MAGSAEATCFAGCCSFSFDDSDETVASLVVAAVGVLVSMAAAGGTSAPWGWEEAAGRIEWGSETGSTAVSADSVEIAGAGAEGGIIGIIAIVAGSASAADVGSAAVLGMGAPRRDEGPGAAVVAATVDG